MAMGKSVWSQSSYQANLMLLSSTWFTSLTTVAELTTKYAMETAMIAWLKCNVCSCAQNVHTQIKCFRRTSIVSSTQKNPHGCSKSRFPVSMITETQSTKEAET